MSLTESQNKKLFNWKSKHKAGEQTYGVTYDFVAYIRDELCDLKIITPSSGHIDTIHGTYHMCPQNSS